MNSDLLMVAEIVAEILLYIHGSVQDLVSPVRSNGSTAVLH